MMVMPMLIARVGLLVGLFVVLSISVKAEVFHCTANFTDGQFSRVSEVDIVVPHPMTRNESLWAAKPKPFESHVLVATAIGVGSIEIVRTATLGLARRTEERQRFDLLITQLPSSSDSLVGIFMEDRKWGHPVLLKADLWDSSKKFTLVRSLTGRGLEVSAGECR